MTRLFYILATIVILGYLTWPFGTLLSFYLALKASDAMVIKRMVDWSSVRNNIADDLKPTAERLLNKKLGISDKPEIKIDVSSMSIALANAIAAEIATPKALIFLFNRPTKLHCFKAFRGKRYSSTKPDCEIVKRMAQSNDDKNFSFRGPNIPRIIEKTNYLFLTNPFTFKFDVMHDGVPVLLKLERQAFAWKLTGVSVNWEKALKGLGD
jgi:hypothetical protein